MVGPARASWAPARFAARDGDRWFCTLCPWRCRLGEGEIGRCGTRIVRDGRLWTTTYGLASHVAVEPIEKKGIYHLAPGARLLSLGSYGCTWRCLHCHNWRFACVERVGGGDAILGPSDIVERALAEGVQGLGWGFNEPTLWAELVVDCMSIAREHGLLGVMATNGFLTPEAREALAPCIDAWRIDVKGIREELFEELGVPGGWQATLETAEELKKRHRRHVEVVTCVIPGRNEDHVPEIAAWIARSLGRDTPYHLTRFYSDHHLTSPPLTPIETLREAGRAARRAGLDHVYVEAGAAGLGTTCCPRCGTVLIERAPAASPVRKDDQGACPRCLTPVLHCGRRGLLPDHQHEEAAPWT